MKDEYLNNLLILVVEDKKPTRLALAYDLEKAFPNATIHQASTTSEAHARIQTAMEKAAIRRSNPRF